jgi:uncharacterized RDD family membrane protein YckC
LAAITYDTFLVLPLIMVCVAIGLSLRAATGLAPHDNTQVSILSASLVQMIALTTVIGFFSYFWLKNGQTLSMQAWRIKLVSSSGGAVRFHQAIIRCLAVSSSGGAVRFHQAIIRCLAALLSVACLGAGYWWCLFDSRGRSWHDHLSGTELLLLPKRDKKKNN